MRYVSVILVAAFLLISCEKNKNSTLEKQKAPFVWEGANIYFLLTDRFNNGDASNDVNFNRTLETGKLRGFEGGDLKGITQKIKKGYFTNVSHRATTPVRDLEIHEVKVALGFGYSTQVYFPIRIATRLEG